MKVLVIYMLMVVSSASVWGQTHVNSSSPDTSISSQISIKAVSLQTYDYRAYQSGELAAQKAQHPFVSRFKPAPKLPPRSLFAQAVDASISYLICPSCAKETRPPFNNNYTYEQGNMAPVYKDQLHR